jgi:hypothetical protein
MLFVFQMLHKMFYLETYGYDQILLFRERTRSNAVGYWFNINAPMRTVMERILLASDALLMVTWYECERDFDELIRYYPLLHYTTYQKPRPGLSDHIEVKGIYFKVDSPRADRLIAVVLAAFYAMNPNNDCDLMDLIYMGQLELSTLVQRLHPARPVRAHPLEVAHVGDAAGPLVGGGVALAEVDGGHAAGAGVEVAVGAGEGGPVADAA